MVTNQIPGFLSKYAGVSHALQEISKRKGLKGADTKIGYVCLEFRVDLALLSTVLNLPPMTGKPHIYPFHDPNSISDVDLHSRIFSSRFSHLVRPHKLCKVRYHQHVYVPGHFIECNIHPKVGHFDTVSRHSIRHRSSLVRALQLLSTKMDTGLEVTNLCKDFKKPQASIAYERGSKMS
ncbi:hypothetical protein GIB67_032524 [Kingdonia uniflora]|uniref:Uncharacterized protein n=1 Tax=Kingdonia uniflora TaxID=39325 RepID=A0A7J7L7U5_9MAGN|nr:hypothetical protein GIB67_032524 [Kingdonia uniflora]